MFRVGKLLGFCADVCEGMRHLESLGLIHGHLTPCNILLSGGLRAKVGEHFFYCLVAKGVGFLACINPLRLPHTLFHNVVALSLTAG